jgi:hypothetical protein
LGIAFCPCFFTSCQNKNVSSPGFIKESGIDFANNVEMIPSIQLILQMFSDVADGAGDFNNDGLQDLYFTGNTVPNKFISIRVT